MFSLNLRDFLKGAVLAILAPVLAIIITSIEAGQLIFDWKLIGTTALAAFIAYLSKNFFTDTEAEAKKTLANARARELN